ncbi:MAG: DUF4153 domain-containing protein [Anaerolineales bacterium]
MPNTSDRYDPVIPEGRSAFVSPPRLALLGLALGLAFELLLDRRFVGVSFPLWIALSLAALLLASRLEGSHPARSPLTLIPLILFFSAMIAVRLEPLTSALNLAATLYLTAWLIRSYRIGDLAGYGWLDLALLPFTVPVEAAVRPWGPLAETGRAVFGEAATRSRAAAVVRGLALALPVAVVFAAILAGADLAFGDYLEQALRWLNLENILDWLRRGIVVLGVGVACLGALVASLRPAKLARRLGLDSWTIPPFLGLIEAAVVLATVDLLFAAFVAVQFRYLFGGHENIARLGYTYSEYARRGFGELLLVGVLSLAMILLLEAVTRRGRAGERRVFVGLSAALVGLVGAMLASAMTRLLLYESAYGFTRLRTYTHVAIVWLAFLFAAFLILLLRDRLRSFGLALAIAGLGISATLDGLGVDGFIVRQNGNRLEQGGELDVLYLNQLSDEAVPDLSALSMSAPAAFRDDLLAGLACRRARLRADRPAMGWPGYHLARANAHAQLEALEPTLGEFAVKRPSSNPWTWSVVRDGREWGCGGSAFDRVGD